MRAFDFSHSLSGISVLLRASLNVPVSKGVVTDDFRLLQALPTISRLMARGARVVLIGHIGRAKTDSLLPVYRALKERGVSPLFFSEAVVGEGVVSLLRKVGKGEVLLLENLRREQGEEENDPVFAEMLASYGSIYINDAFSDSHRAHASIVGVPKCVESYAGPLFLNEYHGIAPALTPPSPSLAIVGGAKFATKEPLIRALLKKYDRVFVGGALANDFLKAGGHEVGRSLTSGTPVSDLITNSKIMLPTDVVVENDEGREVKKVGALHPNDTIYDVGPESVAFLRPFIEKARLILWNGPMGNFEKGFRAETEEVARMVARAKGVSVVGGGDTIASIEKLKLNGRFTHLSTAGGAMLRFIADGTLPGIEALT